MLNRVADFYVAGIQNAGLRMNGVHGGVINIHRHGGWAARRRCFQFGRGDGAFGIDLLSQPMTVDTGSF